MEDSLITKLRRISSLGTSLQEDNVRAFMVIIRKLLDRLNEGNDFLTLRLFCNWSVHIEITNSNHGLRILAKINDALISHKNNSVGIGQSFANKIGFSELKDELSVFLDRYDISTDIITNMGIWKKFIKLLIEIIRDVPIMFPPLNKMDRKKLRIYKRMAANPIKPGACISSLNIRLACDILQLVITHEDSTTLVVFIRYDDLI